MIVFKYLSATCERERAARDEKRRKNGREPPLVEGAAVADRIRVVASIVRRQPFMPAEDMRRLGARNVFDDAAWVPDAEKREQSQQLYRAFLTFCGADPSWFATALRWAWSQPGRFRDLINADDAGAFQVLCWLTIDLCRRARLPDGMWDYTWSHLPGAIDVARRIILAWIRSRLTESEFCRRSGMLRDSLRDYIDTFAAFIAPRVNALVSIERRTAGQVLIGANAIARETRRSPAGALRLIEGGKLPVASVAGQPVSTRDLLRPHRRYGETAVAA